MRHGKLTREQITNMIGSAEVDRLDHENCDFTSRLQTDGDESVEFAASIHTKDTDGNVITVIVYYYQPDQETVDAAEDLGNLDWEIEGYEIS